MFRIFSMKGRIGRMRFFVTQLLSTVLMLGSVFVALQVTGHLWLRFFLLALVFAALYANLCGTFKRLHDLSPQVSPWLLFIPVSNLNIVLILLLAPGKKGKNSYGLSPFAMRRKKQRAKLQAKRGAA